MNHIHSHGAPAAGNQSRDNDADRRQLAGTAAQSRTFFSFILLLLHRAPGCRLTSRQPLLGVSQSCDRVRLPNSTTPTADVMMQSGGNVWHATANTRPPRKILGQPLKVVLLIHGQAGKQQKRQVCHKCAEFTDPNQDGNK